MRFGVCTAIENAGILKAAGWDYVEENVQNFLQPEVADEGWMGEALAERSALPVEAANVLLPGRLKLTGPGVEMGILRGYMERVAERAKRVGIKTLVFGSGAARKVEAGVDRGMARGQIVEFVRMAAEIAGERGVMIVAEHLNRGECNIINSVAEAMEYVTEVGDEWFECLVDSYHFWQEGEQLETLAAAMGHIRHVHVADRGSRLAPGQTAGMEEYAEFFRVLRAGGYDGRVSVEAGWKPGLEEEAGRVLGRMRDAERGGEV